MPAPQLTYMWEMRLMGTRWCTQVLTDFCAAFLALGYLVSGAPFASALPATQLPATQLPATQLYVSPTGNDAAVGTSPTTPLRTVTAAWERIPRSTPLATGITINLAPGVYPRADMPHYWEDRHGTAEAPIVIRALGTPRSPVLLGDLNLFDISHLTIDGITVTPGGDGLHCEQCSHVTVTNSRLDGAGTAQETIKVNQSDHFNIIDSEIANADENVIDFVAVQHSLIERNLIHGAGDWCAYAKGGSIDIVVRSNEIHTCGTGGFTAGQGTGLEFMVAPWLTYEAEDVVLDGNFIHDTEGAAFGVNGGRNIMIENNVATRVGQRSHLIEVTFGYRSCDGNVTRCRLLLDQGAWGTDALGGTAANIPDRDVTVRNNTLVNPPGFTSQWQHFEISTPRTNTGPLIGPSPARTDDGLSITGNTIRNGGPDMPLGVDDSEVCTPSDPTCTIAQVLRDNDINGAIAVPIPDRVPTPTPPAEPAGMVFVPIDPTRAYDSRLEVAGVPSGPIASGTHRRVVVAHGRNLTTGAVTAPDAVPIGATEVAMNLTITDTAGAGFLTAIAGGTTQPATSLINWSGPGVTIANGAPIPLAADRSIEIFAGGGGQAAVVIDIVGFFLPEATPPVGAVFTPLNPTRAYDSRLDTARPLDARMVAPGTSRVIDVGAAIPAIPAAATAIAFNVTAVDTGPVGFLSITPGDHTDFASSTLNWSSARDIVANGTVVQMDAARRITVFARGSATHVIIDVVGFYSAVSSTPDGALFHPVAPARAYDSRWTDYRLAPTEGDRLISIADGHAGDTGALATPGVVPTTAIAVEFNLTITDTRGGAGFASIRPAWVSGTPATSTSNWPAATYTRANASLVVCDRQRLITARAGGDATTHIVLDTLGYYAPRAAL